MMNDDNVLLRTRTMAVASATLEIPIKHWIAERNLLRTAVNNRTRERNYANLCLRLAEGDITEDEFDTEITENEERYVVSFNDDIPVEEIKTAARLTDGILDVDTEDDFRELFSIGCSLITEQ